MPSDIHIPVCTKNTTTKWSTEQHQLCIASRSNTNLQPSELTRMASEYTKLASSVLNHKLSDPNPDSKTSKDLVKFDKLPLVNKNIIKMIQYIDRQDQDDIDMFCPSENFLQMINQGSPAGVQPLFQHEFDNAGLLGNVPLSLSTTIKNDVLIAFPSPSSLAGLCIFYCHPTSIEEVYAEELLRIQEQSTHGKLLRDDIELMTKCKPFIPNDFSSFQHMIKNMTFICEDLGGPHSLTPFG